MRRTALRWGLSLLLCVSAVSLFPAVSLSPIVAQSSNGPDVKKLKNPVPVTPQSVNAGKDTFQKNCRSCHGADGKGKGTMAPKNSQPSDLTDAQWTKGTTDGEIYAVLRDGAGPQSVMKGYKGRMTETELWSVVNYIRSLGPQGTR